MIEVLWIDDECMTDSGKYTSTGQEFIEAAYNKKIEITPMLTYKEGIDAIKNNPLKWCAVILDIHNAKATSGKPSDDFDEARDEIVRLQAVNNQAEPYIFVLSGNKDYQTGSSTIRRPAYCSKAIYDKNGDDYKLLFEDILKIQNVSNLYTYREQYSDVLTIAKKLCGDETNKDLMKLLYRIIANNQKDNDDFLNKMRKILEDVMEGLKRLQYPYFTETKEDITLNNLSRYIGKDEKVPIYIYNVLSTH